MTLNTQLATLPVDLYRDIAIPVEKRLDIHALLLVSRAMYAAALPALYRSLNYENQGRECVAFERLINSTSLALAVRSINLRIDKNSDFKAINVALRATTNLRSLNIVNPSYDLEGMDHLGSIVEGVKFQLYSLRLATYLPRDGGTAKDFLVKQSSLVEDLAFEAWNPEGPVYTILEGMKFPNLRLLASVGSSDSMKGVDKVLKQERVVAFRCDHRIPERGPYRSIRALSTKGWVPGLATLPKFPNLKYLLISIVSTRCLITPPSLD